MPASTPASLQADRLMQHMRALCKEIGPRPPASPQERRAAEYVRQTLADLGVTGVWEQPFKSRTSLGWAVLPYLVGMALAAPFGWLRGWRSKAISGLLWLAGAYGLTEFFKAKPTPFESLISLGDSQNVIATLPPKGEVRRRLFLVGHLDSQKQRFLAPTPDPRTDKIANTMSIVMAALTGLSALVDAARNRRRPSPLLGIAGPTALMGLGMFIRDELQPHIEGANDNATAVSILLGMAEALRKHPLEHTEVTLLFTGCEEVACVGMENFLQRHAPPLQNTHWIDLEMVGTGDLCYVTRHGMSYLTEYIPSPGMVEIAARAAVEHPDLRVIGKDMLMMEEIANLSSRGYECVCIAGYNEQGFLPNWHRLSDTLEHIEPETLGRAARFTWAMMQEIDGL